MGRKKHHHRRVGGVGGAKNTGGGLGAGVQCFIPSEDNPTLPTPNPNGNTKKRALESLSNTKTKQPPPPPNPNPILPLSSTPTSLSSTSTSYPPNLLCSKYHIQALPSSSYTSYLLKPPTPSSTPNISYSYSYNPSEEVLGVSSKDPTSSSLGILELYDISPLPSSTPMLLLPPPNLPELFLDDKDKHWEHGILTLKNHLLSYAYILIHYHISFPPNSQNLSSLTPTHQDKDKEQGEKEVGGVDLLMRYAYDGSILSYIWCEENISAIHSLDPSYPPPPPPLTGTSTPFLLLLVTGRGRGGSVEGSEVRVMNVEDPSSMKHLIIQDERLVYDDSIPPNSQDTSKSFLKPKLAPNILEKSIFLHHSHLPTPPSRFLEVGEVKPLSHLRPPKSYEDGGRIFYFRSWESGNVYVARVSPSSLITRSTQLNYLGARELGVEELGVYAYEDSLIFLSVRNSLENPMNVTCSLDLFSLSPNDDVPNPNPNPKEEAVFRKSLDIPNYQHNVFLEYDADYDPGILILSNYYHQIQDPNSLALSQYYITKTLGTQKHKDNRSIGVEDLAPTTRILNIRDSYIPSSSRHYTPPKILSKSLVNASLLVSYRNSLFLLASEACSSFGGPMYPPGYLLIKRNSYYEEEEDEYDLRPRKTPRGESWFLAPNSSQEVSLVLDPNDADAEGMEGVFHVSGYERGNMLGCLGRRRGMDEASSISHWIYTNLPNSSTLPNLLIPSPSSADIQNNEKGSVPTLLTDGKSDADPDAASGEEKEKKGVEKGELRVEEKRSLGSVPMDGRVLQDFLDFINKKKEDGRKLKAYLSAHGEEIEAWKKQEQEEVEELKKRQKENREKRKMQKESSSTGGTPLPPSPIPQHPPAAPALSSSPSPIQQQQEPVSIEKVDEVLRVTTTSAEEVKEEAGVVAEVGVAQVAADDDMESAGVAEEKTSNDHPTQEQKTMAY